MSRKIFLSILVLSIFAVQTATAAIYTVDDVHSQVHFKVAHLVISNVRGEFTDYVATIEADPENRTIQSVSATINTASIDTGNKKRDDHLRSADFFDVANHPQMTFKSTRVVGKGNDIVVYGELTIRGNTKLVELRGSFAGEVKDPWGNVKAGFEATTTINRKDFGLTWNKTLETGGVVVGEEVEIGLEIEATKAK
ncbi:MAG: hypothetical protein C0623_03480 [Desulfuromonas sp.]|nr:MAG: hypothetical protein C0623_03480 [Desulfuromonas sp.]